MDCYHYSARNQASKTPMPDLTALAVPASNTVARTLSNPPSAPKQVQHKSSYGNAKNAMHFGHTRSQSLTFGKFIIAVNGI